MKITFFGTQPYDRESFDRANERYGFEFNYHRSHLNGNNTSLAQGADAVCIFVNDTADAATIRSLAAMDVKLIALRCAGFNNVDLKAAAEYGIPVVRVPAYSPDAVAEYAVMLTLHCPLTDATRYMIDGAAIGRMKPGVMLINTGRGQLIHTEALIEGLKEKKIGAAGLDVYEEEAAYFYEDTSDRIMDDDVLARLLSFNNVVMTSHQGFFTREALDNIAHTTLQNINDFAVHRELRNEVRAEPEKTMN